MTKASLRPFTATPAAKRAVFTSCAASTMENGAPSASPKRLAAKAITGKAARQRYSHVSDQGRLTRKQAEELFERSKDDRAIIVGSEVRMLCAMALRSLASGDSSAI